MNAMEIGRKTLKTTVPFRLVDMLKGGARVPQRIAYRGGNHYCPVCERCSRKFLPYGVVERRPHARCVHCSALERHRLTWLFLQRRTDLFDGRFKRLLHVAPERMFQKRLRKLLGSGYVSGDLYNPRAMMKMDVTAIPFGTATFDAIYCSHVLEHVEDDRQAMREFRRVLKPGGWALLLVPITAEQTIEDPLITDPRERERVFGQSDHVRRYGPDYEDRLATAGFHVERFSPDTFVSDGEVRSMGLAHERCEMYVARHAAVAGG